MQGQVPGRRIRSKETARVDRSVLPIQARHYPARGMAGLISRWPTPKVVNSDQTRNSYWSKLTPSSTYVLRQASAAESVALPPATGREAVMPQSTHSQFEPIPIERPPCPQCGDQMMLTRIVPGAPGVDQRSFECKGCGQSETVQVKHWQDHAEITHLS
ncbi:MAG: hypothetical protein QOF09_4642 [Alphaproteobacteria bacterium]|nr:hypothetical protein [Alphaproteobacteria bacterium]